MYDLGLRIKTLRQQRGITQETLGRLINKSKSAVCSYETDAQIPPLDVIISIATALNVTLDQLVGFDKDGSISLRYLGKPERQVIDLLLSEFANPTDCGDELSQQQLLILQKLIYIFTKQKN